MSESRQPSHQAAPQRGSAGGAPAESSYSTSQAPAITLPKDGGAIRSWLICETRDDKGNAVLYEYKSEDGDSVDLAQAHECHRGRRDDKRRTANRYLKRITYGNRATALDSNGRRPIFLTDQQISDSDWMFEVVFDYREHDAEMPGPNDTGGWPCRSDPFPLTAPPLRYAHIACVSGC